MKIKLFVLLMAVAGASIGAYAQGVVTFANSVLPDTPDRYVYFEDGITRVTGTQFAAQLYYGATPGSLAAHTAAPSRFRAPGSSLAGTWSTATGASRTLNGGGVGVPLFMQVRVWDLNQFPTFEAAVAGSGVAATSAIFQYTQLLSNPPAPTDTYMVNFSSFTVGFIPEPSSFFLTIPGVAILLWMRNRKRQVKEKRA